MIDWSPASHTLLLFHGSSQKHLTQYDIQPCFRNFLNLISLTRLCNWLTDFFSNHSHSTVLRDQQSSLLDITASILQGLAIGPAAYVITAGDLNATTQGNQFCQFAADTYTSLFQSVMNILVLRNVPISEQSAEQSQTQQQQVVRNHFC